MSVHPDGGSRFAGPLLQADVDNRQESSGLSLPPQRVLTITDPESGELVMRLYVTRFDQLTIDDMVDFYRENYPHHTVAVNPTR